MRLAGYLPIVTMALLLAPAARAGYQIGVRYFSASGAVEMYGKGLSQMLVTDLVQQAGDGGKFAKCGAVIVELERRGDILKELELSKSPLIDPTTRLRQDRLLDATYVIEGSVQPTGSDGMSWSIQMREVATGNVVARDDKTIKLNDLDAPISGAIAERLLGQICNKSYKISGNAGPMKVSGTACNLTLPFTVSGGGGGMTVTFSYAPSNESGGKVSYTGGGSGVTMAGSGTYTVTLKDNGGTIKQTHSGKVLMPGGGSATHTDTLTLTKLDKGC
jgi:Curli production assembly/transport component CsgG